MICGTCGKHNSEHLAFCEDCGARLTRALAGRSSQFPRAAGDMTGCTACGALNLVGTRFCGSCGRALDARALTPRPPAARLTPSPSGAYELASAPPPSPPKAQAEQPVIAPTATCAKCSNPVLLAALFCRHCGTPTRVSAGSAARPPASMPDPFAPVPDPFASPAPPAAAPAIEVPAVTMRTLVMATVEPPVTPRNSGTEVVIAARPQSPAPRSAAEDMLPIIGIPRDVAPHRRASAAPSEMSVISALSAFTRESTLPAEPDPFEPARSGTVGEPRDGDEGDALEEALAVPVFKSDPPTVEGSTDGLEPEEEPLPIPVLKSDPPPPPEAETSAPAASEEQDAAAAVHEPPASQSVTTPPATEEAVAARTLPSSPEDASDPASELTTQPPRAIAASVPSAPEPEGAFVLVGVTQDGSLGSRVVIEGTCDLGRTEGDIVIPGDRYLSPRHARFHVDDGKLLVRDLGSTNGVYRRLRAGEEAPLDNHELILLGQQVLRFEAVKSAEQSLGAATQHGALLFGTPEAVVTGRLEQRTTEGVTRDVFHVRGDRCTLGRESGDVVFTHDPLLSRKHAMVHRKGDAFFLTDLGSSNGTFVQIRGQVTLRAGDELRVGNQLYRVDVAARPEDHVGE